MRIERLYVSKYKNLSDIDITFKSNISLLVGQNGLGKSNLIEILSMIFSELYMAKTEDDILVFLRKKEGFSYEIDYTLNNYSIKLKLDEDANTFTINRYSKDHNNNEHDEKIDFTLFEKEKKHFLPNRIIGYYSGENKRILSILDPHLNKVKEIQKKRVNLDSKLRPIFFAENYHSQLILLTLAIYQDTFIFSKKNNGKLADKILKHYLKIETIESFDIRFNNPDNTGYKKQGIKTLGSGFTGDEADSFWGLKSYPNKLMNLLLNLFPNDFLAYSNDDKEDSRSYVKEIVKFTKITLDAVREEIINTFPNPIDFFDALESTYILGALGEIKVFVKKTTVKELISFEQLSEGEQQLLSVQGMLILTGGEQNLFLLDEPDTHINPNWQREYVDLIKSTLRSTQSHILISTHSPLLVQSYDDEDLLLFRDEEGETIIDHKDYQIENWRLDHVLMSPYFNLPSSRSSHLDQFMKKRLDIIRKGCLTDLDKEHLKELENELGFLPTGETVLEVKNMILINKMIEDLNNK